MVPRRPHTKVFNVLVVYVVGQCYCVFDAVGRQLSIATDFPLSIPFALTMLYNTTDEYDGNIHRELNIKHVHTILNKTKISPFSAYSLLLDKLFSEWYECSSDSKRYAPVCGPRACAPAPFRPYWKSSCSSIRTRCLRPTVHTVLGSALSAAGSPGGQRPRPCSDSLGCWPSLPARQYTKYIKKVISK